MLSPVRVVVGLAAGAPSGFLFIARAMPAAIALPGIDS
jgi:hypothetical protein